MENWQSELAKAERRGYEKGVTEGYKHGVIDGSKKAAIAYKDGQAVGYLSHSHDLLDVLEALKDERVDALRIIDELEPIEKIRLQTNIFIYDHRNKD